jgi:hypothetical protein
VTAVAADFAAPVYVGRTPSNLLTSRALPASAADHYEYSNLKIHSVSHSCSSNRSVCGSKNSGGSIVGLSSSRWYFTDGELR